MCGSVATAVALLVLGAGEPPKCDVLPLPHDQVSLRIDGAEVTRWHFGKDAPRPYLYPFHGAFHNGQGTSLTRMGHPGAPNHDHHRSIWFAHHDVEGHDFWSEHGETQIRQREWLAYEDGGAAMAAFILDWIGKGGEPLLEQEVILRLEPRRPKHTLEIQTSLRAAKSRGQTTLNKTNFGLLAVRVAKSISAHFGDGVISDSEGRVSEKEIFGKSARWMDYSGSLVFGKGPGRAVAPVGITYFDHPGNPNHPAKWHVRSDGWMGASLCMDEAISVSEDDPLVLRYLLAAHSGSYDASQSERLFQEFGHSPGLRVVKATEPHTAFRIERVVP